MYTADVYRRVLPQALHNEWRQQQKCPWPITANIRNYKHKGLNQSQGKQFEGTDYEPNDQNFDYLIFFIKLLKLVPSSAVWSLDFTSLWVELSGDAAPACPPLRKGAMEDLQPVLRPTPKHIHDSSEPTESDSLCTSGFNAVEWDKTKGRQTVCVWCAQIHTHTFAAVSNTTDPVTHTHAVNPFRGVCCGKMTAAYDCVLWFGEDPGLIWLQTVLLAVGSISIRVPSQWAAAHERNLIERCPATFQLGSQAFIIRKTISL